METKHQFLNEALEYAGLKELPTKWDGKSSFDKAIIVVENTANMRFFAIGKYTDNNVSAVKQFGSHGILRALPVEVYPYGSADQRTQNTIKAKYEDTTTAHPTEANMEYGVIGITNFEQASAWIKENATDKRGLQFILTPEQAKRKIALILEEKKALCEKEESKTINETEE